MKKKIEKLIKKYEKLRKEIINPDDLDWEGIGLDGPPEGCETIEDFLFSPANEEYDYDEEDQTQVKAINEFIDDLNRILE